ncbi:MAG: hypothetical protein ACOY94_16970 [Bacillota bacterium]
MNRFLGALQAGDLKAAARLALRPELGQQAAERLGLPAEGFPWHDPPPDRTDFLIREREMRDWELLPKPYQAEFARTLDTYRLTLTDGKRQVTLNLIRKDRNWLVAAVE